MYLYTHCKANICQHKKTIKSSHPGSPSDDVDTNHEEPDEEISHREDEEAMRELLPATAARADNTHGGGEAG